MIVFATTCIISVFVTTFLLLICTKSKKKVAVTTVSYQSKRESDAEANRIASDSSHDTTVQQKPLNHNGNEHRRPHSSSQTSRELPQVPVLGHDTSSLQNSTSQQNGSASEISGSGGSPETKHHSPKGRRLPTPPPEDAQVTSEQRISVSLLENEEDMYAKVEDRPKSDPVRLKIKTLDIPEGSGDSSFYAKVGDVVVDDGDDLYAQVDNETADKDLSDKPSTSAAETGGPSPMADAADNINYGDAEYASIDKMRKSITRKKPAASEEPPAPPIPERNFDAEDEIDATEDNENGNEDNNVEDNNADGGDESQSGPMYAKLCVRESLDHLRHRQEVENERRQRYANIMRPDDPGSTATEVYAQIDETNPEAVYESVSGSGSADGAFQPRPQPHNPDYSSIQDVGLPTAGVADNDISAPSTAHHPNNARPTRQHHYEQIERPV